MYLVLYRKKDLCMTKITIDDKEYDLSDPSEEIKSQIDNLTFVNNLILQKNNELQIAQTAKIGYSRALNRELENLKSKDGTKV